MSEVAYDPLYTESKSKRQGKRRKLNGFLYFLRLRRMTRRKFTNLTAKRNEKIADVVECLMMLYCSNPEQFEQSLYNAGLLAIGTPDNRRKKKQCRFFVRNLRPATKEKFKGMTEQRGTEMTSIMGAMMLMYCRNPEIIRAYLPEVKTNRMRSNK